MTEKDFNTVETTPETQQKTQTRKAPLYNVVLWNDDYHTYDYVINMLQKLFGYPIEQGFQMARTVDTQGKVIVFTGAYEPAEFKRDQIQAFGADPILKGSIGSMFATLERAD
ncbi:MAG: ATP-dependent Clp protease adaptor ClpS [Thermoguttaceae bacterium]|nr:ATP-dependent Clp protease adaptor ClpS [Thermoguttaceae bacterium]